ncbi:hypothetical protein D3C80_2090940 [compost metagenome]
MVDAVNMTMINTSNEIIVCCLHNARVFVVALVFCVFEFVFLDSRSGGVFVNSLRGREKQVGDVSNGFTRRLGFLDTKREQSLFL